MIRHEFDLVNRRGSVLILTVWLLSFLVALTVLLSLQLHRSVQVARAYEQRIWQTVAAEALTARFAYALHYLDKTPDYDASNDGWRSNEFLYKSFPIGSGYSASLSAVRRAPDGKGIGSLEGPGDEVALININKASRELLRQIFETGAGLNGEEARQIANAIQDWRDLDVLLSDPERDTEKEAYAGRYPCKNAPFESVEELLLVHGMTEDLFKKVAPLVTVYGEGRVNLNTVQPDVLRAMGAPDSLGAKILAYRAGPDGREGTKDDGIFEDVGSAEAHLAIGGAALGTEELNAISRMNSDGWLGVRTDFFRLSVVLERQGVRKSQDVIVNRKGRIFEFGR